MTIVPSRVAGRRSSLNKHAASSIGLQENVVTIEYVEALPAPEPLHNFEHDDWINSVDASATGYFLSTSYDRHVRLWNADTQECIVGEQVVYALEQHLNEHSA